MEMLIILSAGPIFFNYMSTKIFMKLILMTNFLKCLSSLASNSLMQVLPFKVTRGGRRFSSFIYKENILESQLTTNLLGFSVS